MKKVITVCAILLSFVLEAQQPGEFIDKRDGKTYKTTVIGTQTWMAENLNSVTFRNGDTIQEAKSNEQWLEASKARKPAWCYYENRAIQDDSINGSNYGKLYNWYVVNDARGLAPIGWHIPTDDEWTILINSCGNLDKKNSNIQQTNCINMISKDGWTQFIGENSVGMNVSPSGFRSDENVDPSNLFNTGEFGLVGIEANFWSSTEIDYNQSKYRLFHRETISTNGKKGDGMSVRCLKN